MVIPIDSSVRSECETKTYTVREKWKKIRSSRLVEEVRRRRAVRAMWIATVGVLRFVYILSPIYRDGKVTRSVTGYK